MISICLGRNKRNFTVPMINGSWILEKPSLIMKNHKLGPTGQVTWLRTSKIPMRDTDGQVFAVLGMYEDITERKQLETQSSGST